MMSPFLLTLAQLQVSPRAGSHGSGHCLASAASGMNASASLFNVHLDLSTWPRTLTLDGKRLFDAKVALAIGEPKTTEALENLLEEAQGWLEVGPWSVMDKNATGPSGDKHDYVTQSSYFWPNPDTPDGCPYVVRDGQYNPEARQWTDSDGLRRAFDSSYVLALAWYYTGYEAFARHASLVIQTWFLDEATRMNPNVNWSSMIPCMTPEENPYTFSGLIGISSRIGFVLDAALILESTKAPGWLPKHTVQLQEWCADMTTWLTETPMGNKTLNAFNNHGVYAHLTGASLGMYSGNNSMASQLLNNVTYRIDDGITANGSQPHELIRTQPFHYSMFTLVGFCRLAALGEKMGIDLWGYTGPEGQSIQKGIEFLIPPALQGNETSIWPYEDKIHFKRSAANDIIHFAAERGSEMALEALASGELGESEGGDRWYIRPAPQELDAQSAVKPDDKDNEKKG